MANKHFIITFISLFFASNFIFGQDLSEFRITEFSFDQFHRKQIIDKETSQPIAFANVGVFERNLGTVSDENGFFRLRIPDEYHDGILRISYIGFEALDIPMTEFLTMTDEQIALRRRETRIERPEPPTRYRTRTLGNSRPRLLSTAPMPNRDKGVELGIILPIRRKTHLTEFRMPVIITDAVADSVLFRLNFYRLVDGGVVTILNEPIYIRQKINRNTRYISVDLRPYNLVVTENTLVTIENIKLQEAQVLTILRLRGRRTFGRDAHSYFEQFPIFTFAMFVTANVER